MSTYISIKRIQAEIEEINEAIDMKIIRGLSYKTLSARHRMLMSQLRSLKTQQAIVFRGIMGRLTRYASVFLL